MPSSRSILVQSLCGLPTNRLEQKVEYVGLSNQCFSCHEVGHIAKECPKMTGQNKGNSVANAHHAQYSGKASNLGVC